MKVAVGSQKIEFFPTDFSYLEILETFLTNVVNISMVDLVMGLI